MTFQLPPSLGYFIQRDTRKEGREPPWFDHDALARHFSCNISLNPSCSYLREIYIYIYIFFFFWLYSMAKFLGLALNPCHSSDNARSLTRWATRELQREILLNKWFREVRPFTQDDQHVTSWWRMRHQIKTNIPQTAVIPITLWLMYQATGQSENAQFLSLLLWLEPRRPQHCCTEQRPWDLGAEVWGSCSAWPALLCIYFVSFWSVTIFIRSHNLVHKHVPLFSREIKSRTTSFLLAGNTMSYVGNLESLSLTHQGLCPKSSSTLPWSPSLSQRLHGVVVGTSGSQIKMTWIQVLALQLTVWVGGDDWTFIWLFLPRKWSWWWKPYNLLKELL